MLPPLDCVARCLREKKKNLRWRGAGVTAERWKPNEKNQPRSAAAAGKIRKVCQLACVNARQTLFSFASVCVCVWGVQRQMRWLSVWGRGLMSWVRRRLGQLINYQNQSRDWTILEDATFSLINSACGQLSVIKPAVILHSFWFQSFNYHQLHRNTSKKKQKQKKSVRPKCLQMETFHPPSKKKKENVTGCLSYHCLIYGAPLKP